MNDYFCIRHEDRATSQQLCVSAARDGGRDTDICTCCDSCRSLCVQLKSDNNLPHVCNFVIPFEGKMVCDVCGVEGP